MKNFLVGCGIFIVVFFALSIFFGESTKYPVIYYFTNEQEGRVEFVLNEDKTAKIKTRFAGNDFIYDTSYNFWINDQIAIKKNGGGHYIIREDYVYQSSDDADAKRYGIKIYRQK